ncbi:non-homologous end joining protein Ku [Cellulomonas iranensis]|uniref:Non-homologous end joining protein Ku n=1 Tax=Cellulomonas iranensis TaxID=76862 RepID=A0ABU0GPT6_9CELL|nr:Ku protein [Cellulomonas iranensis]MDQ0426984.1 DNA end-binding protein Ku [Cellulomonas iranensis]
MRAIWKGAVAFGLVNVPVRLYAATGEHEVRLHQVHREDGGRIRYRKVCSLDGEQVEWADIAKGYETEDGELVVLTDEDFDQLPLSTEREIEVLEFVPAEQVDPILLQKTYYLEPDRTAAKPYALLRGALEQTDRVAVVKVAIRQRESMAVLRVRDKVIVLQTLLWPDEVREADFPVLDDDVSVRPQELTMASSLVESLAADFDPSQYEDAYVTALEELIAAKVSSGDTRAPAAPPEEEGSSEGGAEVVDLLAALQRSVDKARAARGEDADEGSAGAGAGSQKSSRRSASTARGATGGAAKGRASTSSSSTAKGTAKGAAKDAPASKAPAKKTAAKKAPAKKSADDGDATPARRKARSKAS